MIICQNCGTQNYDGSQYCDECGTKLTCERADEIVFRQSSPDAPVYQASNVTSVVMPPVAISKERPSQNKEKRPHAVLRIERGEAAGTEFPLSAEESYIGRWDADNGVFPDVDLDTHDNEAKVSRRHARIMMHDGRYTVEDLGSTNGTYINRGKRLLPGNIHILNDGDELIVGKTFLRFNIIN